MLNRSIAALLGAAMVCTLGLPLIVRAQEKPRLAVLEFDADEEAEEEADAVTEEIRADYVHSRRYVVVDRTLTDKIMDEWALQQSGVTEQANTVRVGKLFTVKTLVTGKLNEFSQGGWQISAAVLDAETGVTSAAETARHPGA